jgi:Cof subfamily protein (haloacid dehalogenase superfamily)
MGKFDGVLICTDLDGTLFRNDKTISRENKEAISYFKREGGLFTFITGRLPYYSMSAYHAAEPNAAFGCINGGALYDGAKKEYVWRCEVPETVMELVRYIDERFANVGIQVAGFQNTYFLKENDTMVWFRQVSNVPNLLCDYGHLQEPIAKIIFGSNDNDEILALERALNEHPLSKEFSLIRTEARLFEILPKGMHKGVALTKLVEHLHIDAKKTFAVGDYNNDIGMFRAARYGIAVSNACKDALDAADFVTVSNEEHALARVIYDIESGKYPL